MTLALVVSYAALARAFADDGIALLALACSVLALRIAIRADRRWRDPWVMDWRRRR